MTAHSNIYDPLKLESSQVRLFTIRPAVLGMIECDLEVRSRNEKPQYEALSYVWGTRDYDTEILLNGHVFPVGMNLGFALDDLRLVDKSRTLWIDAICVNQGDKKERSSQVLLMHQIYKCASRVVVWLGFETPEDVSALNLLIAVKDMITFNGSVNGSEAPSQSDIAKVRRYLDTNPSAKAGLSNLFRDLLMQKWWGRVWVIQEVAVSSRATVVVGKSELEWSSLCNAIGMVILSGAVPIQLGSPIFRDEYSSISSLSNIEALRRMVEQGHFPSISTLVAGNRQAATDPRDLVYAFLGLAKMNDDPLLKPDYSDSNSASDVFINLFEYSFRVEKSLDIVCMSQGRIGAHLPSWCPDWTRPPRLGWDFEPDLSNRCPFPLMSKYINFLARNIWHACGDTSPTAKIIRSPPTLVCNGLLVDKIEVIGSPIVMGYPFVWNRLIINLHPWENLIIKHFMRTRGASVMEPGSPSIFDVTDQYHRLMVSLTESPDVAPWAPDFFSVVAVLKSLKAISKPIYWSHRTLQKAWRKIGLLFKGGKGHYIGGGALAEAYARTLATNRLSNGNQMTDDDYKMFWSKVPISLNDPAAPNPAQFQKSLVASMMQNTCARTLVLTKKGYLGLGPTRAQKGDLVCVLYGCSVPVVIRKYGRNHRFVGESYVHGLMNGAAVQQFLEGTIQEREFILR